MAIAREAWPAGRRRSGRRARTPALRHVRVYGRPSRKLLAGVVWWGAAAMCAALCWASPLVGALAIWGFVRAWDAARPYEQIERLEGRHGG